MLDSALRGITTALLLTFLTSTIVVKGGPYTLQKAANVFLFMLNKGLLKGNICDDNSIAVKHTIFEGLITNPSSVIKRKWDLIPFRVSERKSPIAAITVWPRAVINKTAHHIICANLNGNGTHIFPGCQAITHTINQSFNQLLTAANLYVANLTNFL